MKYINKDAFWDAMEKQGIQTLGRLSHASGLSYCLIRRVLEQDEIFTIKSLFRIADTLDINPGDLLLDREEMGD